MQKRNFILLTAALLLGATFTLTKTNAADFPKDSPNFLTAYDAALKASKDSGKPLVLVFSASWCPPCQMNKKQVYPSTAVKPYHDKFVWAYLDADAEANVAAMQKFGVTGIPHIQFLGKDGKALGNVVGGVAPEEFAKTLDATLKKAGS